MNYTRHASERLRSIKSASRMHARGAQWLAGRRLACAGVRASKRVGLEGDMAVYVEGGPERVSRLFSLKYDAVCCRNCVSASINEALVQCGRNAPTVSWACARVWFPCRLVKL